MTDPATMLATKAAQSAANLGASRLRAFWAKDQEAHKLLVAITRAVVADSDIPQIVRSGLADKLEVDLRVDPTVHGALERILRADDDSEAAKLLLAARVAQLVQSAITWPAGYSAALFGHRVAQHAAEAVNPVKASDRAAAHVDARLTREEIRELRAELSTISEFLLAQRNEAVDYVHSFGQRFVPSTTGA